MKRIPYGNSNFEKIMTENYYFIDKTKYIEELEKLGSQYLFFLRPRKFGKSLFVSMLEHYYDINKKEQFNILFKDTYLMIDEYDNFANNILIEHGQELYMSVTHAGGFLRSFFAVIKAGTDTKTIDRIYITGVSPLVLADVTSGFNIGDNISLNRRFSEMVGVNNQELLEIINYYISEKQIRPENKDKIIQEITNWYNGYLFNFEANKLCNTDMVLYFLKEYMENDRIPIDMLDENVRTDYGKIKYLIILNNKLNGNFDILREILEKEETACELVKSFAIAEEIDRKKFTSLLYYLGLITISSKIGTSLVFKIPNRIIRGMIWEFITKSIEDVYKLKVDTFNLDKFFRNLAFKGEWKEFFSYLLDKFYEASSIRDFIYREEGVKGFLLAYLNMTTLFIVHSEPEFNKGFADIYLEPDIRFPEIKSGFLIELKYLKAKKISKAIIDKEFEMAKKQLERYAVDKKMPKGTREIVIVLSAKKVLKIEEKR